MADSQILGFHENRPLRAVLMLCHGVLQINPENRLCSLMLGQTGIPARVLDGYTGCTNIQEFHQIIGQLRDLGFLKPLGDRQDQLFCRKFFVRIQESVPQ